jgi:hypothetical protein
MDPAPRSTRRATAAPAPLLAESRRALAAGAALAAVALAALVWVLLPGGQPAPSAPAEEPRPVQPPAAFVELEKFSAASRDADAILARCERVRPLVRNTAWAHRVSEIEARAREIKELTAKPVPPLPPPPPTPAPIEPILLASWTATVSGPALRLKGEGDARYLGNWHGTGDLAEWSVEIPRAGRWRVEITAAMMDTGGGEALFIAGDRRLAWTVATTGSFREYRTSVLGTAEFPAGRLACSLRASSVKGPGLLNLRSLRLVPE